MTVPIEAYPVMDSQLESDFTSKIDFGNRLIGESCVLTKELRNTIDLRFDFEIAVSKLSPEFEIWPLKGVVPGKGAIQVRFSFTPS